MGFSPRTICRTTILVNRLHTIFIVFTYVKRKTNDVSVLENGVARLVHSTNKNIHLLLISTTVNDFR